jgi:hypothetical protein
MAAAPTTPPEAVVISTVVLVVISTVVPVVLSTVVPVVQTAELSRNSQAGKRTDPPDTRIAVKLCQLCQTQARSRANRERVHEPWLSWTGSFDVAIETRE